MYTNTIKIEYLSYKIYTAGVVAPLSPLLLHRVVQHQRLGLG